MRTSSIPTYFHSIEDIDIDMYSTPPVVADTNNSFQIFITHGYYLPTDSNTFLMKPMKRFIYQTGNVLLSLTCWKISAVN